MKSLITISSLQVSKHLSKDHLQNVILTIDKAIIKISESIDDIDLKEAWKKAKGILTGSLNHLSLNHLVHPSKWSKAEWIAAAVSLIAMQGLITTGLSVLGVYSMLLSSSLFLFMSGIILQIGLGIANRNPRKMYYPKEQQNVPGDSVRQN